MSKSILMVLEYLKTFQALHLSTKKVLEERDIHKEHHCTKSINSSSHKESKIYIM